MVPNMEVSCCIDQDFSRVGLPAPEPLYEVGHFGSPSTAIQTPPDRAECHLSAPRSIAAHMGETEVDQRPFSHCSEIVILRGCEHRISPPRRGGQSISRRPENARPRVTSSAYSRSPPTGSPEARRVTVTPSDPSSRTR